MSVVGTNSSSAIDGSMRKVVGVIQLAADDSDFKEMLTSNTLKALSSRDIDLGLEEQKLLLYVIEGHGDSSIAEQSLLLEPSWLPRLLAYKEQVLGDQ